MVAAITAIAAVLALAGCAEPSSGSGSAGGGGAASPTTASSQAPTTTPRASNPPTTVPSTTRPPATTPPVAGDTVTVRGTVRKGVEPGCMLVDGQDRKAYLLIGQSIRATLQAGARVVVVGQRVETFANTCGEDAALAVVSVTRLR